MFRVAIGAILVFQLHSLVAITVYAALFVLSLGSVALAAALVALGLVPVVEPFLVGLGLALFTSVLLVALGLASRLALDTSALFALVQWVIELFAIAIRNTVDDARTIVTLSSHFFGLVLLAVFAIVISESLALATTLLGALGPLGPLRKRANLTSLNRLALHTTIGARAHLALFLIGIVLTVQENLVANLALTSLHKHTLAVLVLHFSRRTHTTRFACLRLFAFIVAFLRHACKITRVTAVTEHFIVLAIFFARHFVTRFLLAIGSLALFATVWLDALSRSLFLALVARFGTIAPRRPLGPLTVHLATLGVARQSLGESFVQATFGISYDTSGALGRACSAGFGAFGP